MANHKTLDKILALDPIKDHQQIVFLTSAYEFPWDMTRALEFALFRTYALPETSALRARSAAVRLLPERHKPFLRTQQRHRSYPNGYKIEELGPKIES